MIHTVLNIDLSFLENDAIIAFICFWLLYLTYYFSSNFPFIKTINKLFNESIEDLEKPIYLRRSIGFFLLGVIPFIITLLFFDKPIIDYGISLPSGKNIWLWFLIPVTLFTVVSFLRSNRKIDLSYYPEVRKEVWIKKSFIKNSIFWIIYLLGYEFLLRGMVFFACLYEFGLWPAIFINSVIYSLIHIFKGYKEAYGAFFIGIIFCLITYYTNSLWIAFIIHVLIAIINDYKAIQAKHKMS